MTVAPQKRAAKEPSRGAASDAVQRRPAPGDPRSASAAVKLSTALVVGVLVGVAASLPGTWRQGLLAGWVLGALTYLIWVWHAVWRLDARQTAADALREDPGTQLADTVVICAAMASLAAVGLLLSGSSSSAAGGKFGQAAITVLSVATAWGVVHTNFTLRYARLYYTGADGGISFNEDDPPQYSDFAYLAFTLGMTFQVSDTDLSTKAIRATALRHALLSYIFGTVIIASVINLVAGLSK